MLNFEIKLDENENLYLETDLSGKLLLSVAQFNKGSAFSEAERLAFGLYGKLPAHVETIEQQARRTYNEFSQFSTNLQKHAYLSNLHNTNQTLFFNLVVRHLAEMIPIIYTPTVGDAVKQFSHKFSQARGLYITFNDKNRIHEIIQNRSQPDIKVIVVSDGGGVLGIGDQGAGAMLIPVAKLIVYTLLAGVNPLNTLPILLDVGTDNEELLNDPFYLGWRHPRIHGQKYDEFINQFVTAVETEFPDVFLHWEDFGRDNATRNLKKFRKRNCTFNDDIQGTGVVTLAALTAGINHNKHQLINQKIIIFGGGTAGIGIANQIHNSMISKGLTAQAAYAHFWVIDRAGLLTKDMQALTEDQIPFARDSAEVKNWQTETAHFTSLLDVIKNVKPHILIGCSTVYGAFNQAVIEAMCASGDTRPLIFPLSNPTEKAEATPQDIYHWSKGKALVATGSPFPPVTFQDQKIHVAQCNNALVFPGIGLGSIAVKASQVTDNMLAAACTALAKAAPINADPMEALLPFIADAKNSTLEIAASVARQAQADGVAKIMDKDVEKLIQALQWAPEYIPYRLKAT